MVLIELISLRYFISPLINQTKITDKNSNFGYEKTDMEEGR